MRKFTKAMAVTVTLTAGLVAAPALYAHDPGNTEDRGSMMENGTIGQNGMMGMMGQMSRMMETCNAMMQAMMGDHDSSAPNDRHKETPATPGNNG